MLVGNRDTLFSDTITDRYEYRFIGTSDTICNTIKDYAIGELNWLANGYISYFAMCVIRHSHVFRVHHAAR